MESKKVRKIIMVIKYTGQAALTSSDFQCFYTYPLEGRKLELSVSLSPSTPEGS